MPSIFDHTNYLDFLRMSAQRHLAKRNRKSTYQDLAKNLGYRSPRSLGMVLKGDRLPSSEMVQAFSQYLRLSPLEHRYLELMVELAKCNRDRKPADDVVGEMQKISPASKPKANVTEDQVSIISEWFHLVIKQMISMPGFVEDVDWIAKNLGTKISKAEIRESLQTLSKVGLIRRNHRQKYEVTNKRVISSHDIPSEALRQHHKSMLHTAVTALDRQPVEIREFSGMTFKIRKDKVGAAKDALRKFMDSFESAFEDENGNDIYQLNIQFYSHLQQMKDKH